MAPTLALVLALLLSLVSLSTAKDNVALNAPVTAAPGWSPPSLANDGTVGVSSVNNCFHSSDAAQDPPGWWRVDLGAVYPLNNITIHFFNNGDGVDRSRGMAVYVQNSMGPKELCTTITEPSLQNKTVSCPQTGQFLELRKTADAPVQAIALCEVQVFVADCPSKTYGTACTPCGRCLNGVDCDKTSGACPGSCDPGWTGTRCGTECSIGCQPRTCSQTTGNCTGGCDSGWWGPKCDQQCSSGCQPSTCTQATGDCTGECGSGLWGPKCDKSCSMNCAQGTCAKDEGACDRGCTNGWWGTKCDQQCSSNCQLSVCSQTTGNCTGGCISGWWGPKCGLQCSNDCQPRNCTQDTGYCTGGCGTGLWGPTCGLPCSPNCAQRSCDRSSAACTGGCKNGWRGSTCNQTCQARTFGANCAGVCGHCPCHPINATCTGPCDSGWEGPLCNQTCGSGTYGTNCTSQCGECLQQPCHHANGFCFGGCVSGKTGDLCKDVQPSDNKQAAIIGGAVGGSLAFILVLVLVILAVCLVRRKRKQRGPDGVRERSKRLTKRKKPLSTVEDVSGHYKVGVAGSLTSSAKPAVVARQVKGQEESDDVRGDVEACHYINVKAGDSSQGGIPVTSFPQHVKVMTTQKKFKPEYESVSSDFLKPYEVSQKKEHAGKNKFKTYYPYDDNRVVLETLPGDPHSHYINASHVDGFDSPKAFIAAQAPTKVTLPDFLRMLWQQHCSHVVMLTNLWEEGRAKCERYFPENAGEDLEAGEITVTLAQETAMSYCVVRLLTLSHKSGESRTIRQFHFTTWPDHGVPSHVDMLDFFWKVRSAWTPDSGPLLVHCSAGVGRTGTFIGLCLLSEQAASQHRVDPLATLTSLRHQRRNMIQTLEQYEFLHEVLERVLVFGKTAVSKTDFGDHYRRLQGSTFLGTKTLDQIKQVLPSLCEARKEEDFQACDESNVYSNTWNYQDAAIHLSTVRLSSGCVQVRLCPGGQEDVAPKGLWSFLSRVASPVLVDVHSGQRACVRQPDEAGETEDGSLTVQWQAPAVLATGVSLRSVLVKDENKETQVTYLSYNWRKAEASRGLVPAVSHLCSLQLSTCPSPVTLIFRAAEDERAANLLSACLNVAQAVLLDSQVELVNNVLRVRASFSPEMVVRCADFAQAFMQVTDVYANA